jgi:endonuclease/exonuclease/phosphatase (EEP) superfamily protein YafD
MVRGWRNFLGWLGLLYRLSWAAHPVVWIENNSVHSSSFVLVSLRLIPPETRLDLWSTACWRAHLHDRLVRKEQMQKLVDHLGSFKSDIPYIVGGDFNSPAGDAVSRLLKPRLKDTFREGGIGWGNTGVNEFPVSRPDQIWVSRDFKAIAAWAVKTRNSDHRMVVCDVILHP